jgi:hypothetical protein
MQFAAMSLLDEIPGSDVFVRALLEEAKNPSNKKLCSKKKVEILIDVRNVHTTAGLLPLGMRFHEYRDRKLEELRRATGETFSRATNYIQVYETATMDKRKAIEIGIPTMTAVKGTTDKVEVLIHERLLVVAIEDYYKVFMDHAKVVLNLPSPPVHLQALVAQTVAYVSRLKHSTFCYEMSLQMNPHVMVLEEAFCRWRAVMPTTALLRHI